MITDWNKDALWAFLTGHPSIEMEVRQIVFAASAMEKAAMDVNTSPADAILAARSFSNSVEVLERIGVTGNPHAALEAVRVLYHDPTLQIIAETSRYPHVRESAQKKLMWPKVIPSLRAHSLIPGQEF